MYKINFVTVKPNSLQIVKKLIKLLQINKVTQRETE